MPGDHSEVAPLLPIPNRTVKRLSAEDSADSRVKVGHRQALTALKTPPRFTPGGVLFFQDLFSSFLRSVDFLSAGLTAAGVRAGVAPFSWVPALIGALPDLPL